MFLANQRCVDSNLQLKAEEMVCTTNHRRLILAFKATTCFQPCISKVTRIFTDKLTKFYFNA
jgi:hypothetical protein